MQIQVEKVEGEIRDGFYVQPIMKRAWAAQIEVLKEIEAICKRHDLHYFALWGTLLGAVRHNGFIPWDDDMDIGMMRLDYEKFIHYAKKELPDGWSVIDYKEEGFDELLIRVVNSLDINFSQEFMDRFHGCPYAMGVDIFCMDNIPKDKIEEERLLNALGITAGVAIHMDDDPMTEEEQEELIKGVEEFTGYQFDREKSIKKQLLYLGDRIAAMYWDEEVDEVSLMYLLQSKPEYRIPREGFDNLIEVPFENTTIFIPECYDLILKASYGDDYMIPNYSGSSHEYPFFRKQIQRVAEYFENMGQTCPEVFMMQLEDE